MNRHVDSPNPSLRDIARRKYQDRTLDCSVRIEGLTELVYLYWARSLAGNRDIPGFSIYFEFWLAANRNHGASIELDANTPKINLFIQTYSGKKVSKSLPKGCSDWIER